MKLVHVVAGASLTAMMGILACRTAPTAAHAVVAPGDAGAAAAFVPEATEGATGQLVAFATESELDGFLEAWRDRERHENDARMRPYPMKGPPSDAGVPETAPVMKDDFAKPKAAESRAPAAPAPAARASSDKKAGGKAESITNNQTEGVDEGDIVKLHGDHLVVLRRGRLFTISLKSGESTRSDTVEAFGPGIDPSGTWYDEMLIEGDNLVVTGFSYARGGTEIGLFRIDAAGGLHYRSTYHLRSNDYYSARNYASRIVDGHLVFYTPTYLTAQGGQRDETWPAVRRWHQGAQPTEFSRTLRTNRLFHLDKELPESSQAALHTVTSCDLRSADFTCDSVGLIGPPGRVFYVSDSNVYVWMREWTRREGQSHSPGLLAKIPLKPNQDVTAIRVTGMPTDQFSFDESNGFLNVLVRADGNGDAMFGSETTAGRAALMRVPLGLFSSGVPAAADSRYRRLPAPDGYTMQNRFVGSWLLYGAGNGYWERQQQAHGQLYATEVTATTEPKLVNLEQGVDRIEPMGDHAVVVGSRESDLVFTPIELGQGPHRGQVRAHRDYVRKHASQGELRSHGFFYKDTAKAGGPSQGMVGLPIRGEGARGSRYLEEGSASVLFLSETGLELGELGTLEARPIRSINDGCRASCVDWYGNARPIFVGDRVFALMGYELVEGQITKAKLGERGRLDFAPHGGPPAREWE